METSITTEHKHWYMYSDAMRYFLYVPEKLRIVMNQNDYDVADVDDYYMRKLKFLQDHHFFDKDEVCFHIEYTEDLVKQNMAWLRINVISNANIVVMVSFILIMIGGKLVIRLLIMSKC